MIHRQSPSYHHQRFRPNCQQEFERCRKVYTKGVSLSKVAMRAVEARLERNFGFNNSRDNRSWQATLYNRKTAEMVNPQVNWTLAGGSARGGYAGRRGRTKCGWVFFNAR